MPRPVPWLLLALLVAGVWASVVVRPSTWLSDDHIFIVTSRATPATAFTQDSYAATGYRGAEPFVYRPVGLLGLRAERELFGTGSTRPWHAVSVGLQAAAALLLAAWLAALGLDRRAAIAAAAVWAVSPIHAEAVAWSSAHFQLGSTVLTLTALLFAARGRGWSTVVAFALALFVKETAVAALPALFLSLWIGHKERAAAAPAAMAITLVTAAYFLLRAHAGVRAGLPEAFSPAALLGAVGSGCLRFLGLQDLAVVAGPPLHPPTALQLVALAAVLGLAVLAVVRRGRPALAVAALMLVPLPTLIVGQRAIGVFPESDQWFHLGTAALPALAAMLLPRRAGALLAVLAATWLATRAVEESSHYRDFVAVLDRHVELGQDSAYVRFVRATEQRSPCAAADDFGRCLALPGPDDGRAQCARALQVALYRCARGGAAPPARAPRSPSP